MRLSYKPVVAMSALGLLALLGFGLGAANATTAGFNLSLRSDPVRLPTLELPAQTTALLLGVVCAALAGWSFAQVRAGHRTSWVVPALFGLCWVLAFIVWAVSHGRTSTEISLVGLLQGSVALAVPLIFGAMSGVLCERAGVINIAIEGQLLAGAFLSALVASRTGNLIAGLAAAAVAGALVSSLLAVFAIRYRVDQIVLGVVLNVLVIGLTSFLFSAFMSTDPARNNSPGVLSRIAVPLLSDIPLLGPVLFQQSVIVYAMYVIVAVIHLGLFKTRWGLRVRSVGEHPEAADTVGIRVNRVRFRNVMLAGLVAGFGGAYFTLGAVGGFGEQMTAGKGFIALAALIFGRWTPLGALGAALFFGFADNMQALLGIIGTAIPSDIMLMAPYVATILAVAGLVGRVRPPAADGQPYPAR
ncbi:MAG: ABC transporter permease [Actinomycetota bacterium]|nr:ABC transporter permease [Actinomycetota bacterium]